MKVFFDTEFTGLHQKTTLISIGCVAEDGRTFYAECNDYDMSQVDDWLRKNVIAHLQWTRRGGHSAAWVDTPSELMNDNHVGLWAGSHLVGDEFKAWSAQYESIEMWSDCLAYDWVLFCDLFGGVFGIPKTVYYIPFDLATLFKVKGIDPDVSREEYAGLTGGNKHNALHDAMVIKACYEKALGET